MDTVNIDVPEIDNIIKNTLVYIVNKFPSVAERYGDFISKFNLDLDSDVKVDFDMDLKSAEKYIITLKIQKYMESLEKQKHDLMVRGLSGESDVSQEIRRIDDEINRMREKFDLLV